MLRRLGFWVILLTISSAGRVSAQSEAPPSLLTLRGRYQEALDEWQQTRARRVQAWCDEYAAGLDHLEKDLKGQGDLAGLYQIREERDRFLKMREIPTVASGSLEGLSALQDRFRERSDRELLELASQLVALNESYVRQLAALESMLERQKDTDGAAAVAAEVDQVLEDPLVQRSLAKVRAATPDAEDEEKEVPSNEEPAAPERTQKLPAYHIYTPVTEPSIDQKSIRPLRLFYTSQESRAASMDYALRAQVYEVDGKIADRLRREGIEFQRVEQDTTWHIPRIEVIARNRDIASNSTLVVEYFSRRVGSSERQKSRVEWVPLPTVARGQSIVVDAAGLDLYLQRSRHGDNGRELTGLIFSLYNPTSALLFQQCWPQSLEREASPDMPEPSHRNRGQASASTSRSPP